MKKWLYVVLPVFMATFTGIKAESPQSTTLSMELPSRGPNYYASYNSLEFVQGYRNYILRYEHNGSYYERPFYRDREEWGWAISAGEQLVKDGCRNISLVCYNFLTKESYTIIPDWRYFASSYRPNPFMNNAIRGFGEKYPYFLHTEHISKLRRFTVDGGMMFSRNTKVGVVSALYIQSRAYKYHTERLGRLLKTPKCQKEYADRFGADSLKIALKNLRDLKVANIPYLLGD